MARLDCPHCGKLGQLHAERIVQGKEALTTYHCDACNREWDERDGDNPDVPPPFRMREGPAPRRNT